MVSLLLRIWKREGVAGFFKGFTANMINTFSMCELTRYPFLPETTRPS